MKRGGHPSGMHVVLSGATGLVGRALSSHLVGQGYRVTAWVRDVERARSELGPELEYMATTDRDALETAIASADAVVHLAGAPIVGKRWSNARKRELTDSRVETSRILVDAIRHRATPLAVLISASAVGYYGDRGAELLTETDGPGTGFAAELCEQWEAAALSVGPAARRVVLARIGIVLARNGGAFGPLSRLARFGLAGPIAGGTQWIPWIHLDDVVRALTFALVAPELSGPVNVVGPSPVPQRAFARALGRAFRRPAVLPAPRLAIRAMLGEAASVLLASQRAVPVVLEKHGFQFSFPQLDAAIDDLVHVHDLAIRRLAKSDLPATPYLAAHPARYVLVARTIIERPLAEVMAFFSNAENLSRLTPPELEFAIQTPRPIAMAAGTVIDYQIRLSRIPLRWRTVIEQWEPGVMFVDAQHRGPYACWWHEHRFRSDGARTIMEDRVYYAPPLGILGWIANRLFVAGQLRGIFAYRGHAIRMRFGLAPAHAPSSAQPSAEIAGSARNAGRANKYP